MARPSRDGATVAGLPLVTVGDAHSGRLADDAAGGQDRQALDHVIQQAGHALASHLLVVAEREMHGPIEPTYGEAWDQRKDSRDKAFHIGGTATIEAVAPLRQAEWIRRPVLTIDRHHIGVTGQNDTRSIDRPDRRKKIGFSPLFVGHQIGTDAKTVKKILDEGDEIEIGIPTRRIEGYQGVPSRSRQSSEGGIKDPQ